MNLKITLKIWTNTILLIFIAISFLFLYTIYEAKNKLLSFKEIESNFVVFTTSKKQLEGLEKTFSQYLQTREKQQEEDLTYEIRNLQERWQEVISQENDPVLSPKFRFLSKNFEEIQKSLTTFIKQGNFDNIAVMTTLQKINEAENNLDNIKRAHLNSEIGKINQDLRDFMTLDLILLTISCSFGIILILWLNFQLSSRISSNIHTTTQAINRALSGERGIIIHTNIPEFRPLTNACNLLVKTLHEHSEICKKEVEKSDQIRKVLIEIFKEPIFVVAFNGDILATNTAFRLLVDSQENLFFAKLQQAIKSNNQEEFDVEGITYLLMPQITPRSCDFDGKVFQIKKK